MMNKEETYEEYAIGEKNLYQCPKCKAMRWI